jgi:aminotransferase
VRKVHDFLTVGAAAPLQVAAAAALQMDESYYRELGEFYRVRRDLLLNVLTTAGFECIKPAGAYYIMAGIRSLGGEDDVAFALRLIERIGVASVPGSSFFRSGNHDGSLYIRFCFCKQLTTLQMAAEKLKNINRLFLD